MTCRAALLALSCVSCVQYGISPLERTDLFQQKPRPLVDVLLVLDNSTSMVEEQANLALSFSGLLDSFADSEVDWRIGLTTTETLNSARRGRLEGTKDEVLLRDLEGGDLDEVRWDEDWSAAAGESMQLDPNCYGAKANDKRESWCAGPPTPGARNLSCPEAEAGEERAGDGLIVTELYTSPAGGEGCEWVELYNAGEEPAPLSGLSLADEALDRVVLEAEGDLAPGDYALIARSVGGGSCAVELEGQAIIEVDGGFHLTDPQLWVERSTPDAEEAMAQLVSVTLDSSGLEMGLEAARLALSEVFQERLNQGFLRDEASLAVVFVSDEDDLSPDPVDQYIFDLRSLKGEEAFRDTRMVQLVAITGVDPPDAQGYACQSALGQAELGSRYVAAAGRSGGLFRSLCDPFADVFDELGLTLSGFESTFGLSGLPLLDTLVLRLRADAEARPQEMERDRDYSLLWSPDGAGSGWVYVYFDEERLPPSESWVEVSYDLLPAGTDPDEHYAELAVAQ